MATKLQEGRLTLRTEHHSDGTYTIYYADGGQDTYQEWRSNDGTQLYAKTLERTISNGDGTSTRYWSNGTSDVIGTKKAAVSSVQPVAPVKPKSTVKIQYGANTFSGGGAVSGEASVGSGAISGASGKVAVISQSGLPVQKIESSPQAVKFASVANQEFAMVDISRDENYRKYFQQNPSVKIPEHGHLLDKEFADELVAYAKEKKIKYVYNSAYRKASDMDDDGTSHLTGNSIDVETVVYGSEINPDGSISMSAMEAAKAEKDVRRNEMISDWHGNNTTYKGDLVSGSVVYPTAQNPSGVLYPITGSGGLVNASPKERWHIGRKGKTSVTDQREISIKDQMASKYTLQLKTDPKITGVVADKSGNASAVKFSESGNFIETTPIGQVRPMTTDALRKVSAGGPATGASDGKVGNNDFVNLIRTKPAIPRDLSGTPTNRAVNVSSEQLNNLRNVSESDYKINTITNKLIKNAFNNRLPFGTQDKHNGPAAAIKLVLDKLFADKLTQAAKKTWEQIKNSGIDYIDNFLIERMTKVDEERYNIAQSVSDEYKIYFAGRRPTVMSVSGKLYNTYNQQWWYDFDYFYENFLRGSRAVENRIRAFLTIADAVYEIIILKFAVNGDSNFDNLLTFNLDYVLLQTLHTGEYKDPVTRGAGDLSAAQAPLSLSQTELSPDMSKFVDNYTNAIIPAATGMPMLPGVITTDNNTNEKAVSREDLKNSDYAKLEKQILLNKSNINNIDEFKLKQAASGKNLFATPGYFGEDTDNIRQISKFDDEASAVNTKYNTAPRINDDPSISPTQYINTQSNLIKAPKSPETYNNKPPSDYAPSLPDNLRKAAWAKEAVNTNKNTQADLSATYPNLSQPFSAQDRARARALESDAKALGKEISAAYNSGSNTGQKIDYTLQALSNPRLIAKTVGIVTEAEQMINNKLNVYKPELKKLENQLKSIGKSYAEAWRNRKR